MNIYLENVLRGFINVNNYVELEEEMRDTPEFLLADIDGDDMPEMVICFNEEHEDYIGTLKRKAGTWYLEQVKKDTSDPEESVRGIITSHDNTRLSTKTVGNAFYLNDLFDKDETKFISIINEDVYYGTIRLDTNQDYGMNQEVLDLKQGNVIGSTSTDTVYLLGDRPQGESSHLIRNARVVVKDGASGEMISIKVPMEKGYYPRLFIGDFTGDRKSDILVSMLTGGPDGTINAYIYTFEGNEPKLIFDSGEYNVKNNGLVEYKDNYKVKVTTQKPPTRYSLDVSEHDDEYLTKIYDKEGYLLDEAYGEIEGLISLNPVDYQNIGIYSLDAIQRARGPEQSNTLGLIETFLVWDRTEEAFVPFIQYFSLYGKPALG